MKKIITGLVVGAIADEVATDLFLAFGFPKHTAKVIGAIIGALA